MAKSETLVKNNIAGDGLSVFQARFAELFVKHAGNASEAYHELKPTALRSSAGTEGSKLLQLPEIQARIRQLLDAQFNESFVLGSLGNLAHTAESESVRVRALSVIADCIGLKNKNKNAGNTPVVPMQFNINIPSRRDVVDAPIVDASP